MHARLLAFVVTCTAAAFACLPAYDFVSSGASAPDSSLPDANAPDVDGGADAPPDQDGAASDATLDTLPAANEAGGLPFELLAAGSDHTCALRSGGALYCWGSNSAGQLGRGPDGPDGSDYHPAPVLASVDAAAPLTGAAQSLAGSEYSCTLVAGTPYCWGSDDNAQLGDNDYVDKSAPTPVLSATSNLPLTGIARVVTGKIAACGLEASTGHWLCWGNNLWGQLSDSVMLTTFHTAVRISALDGAQSVAMGYVHTCAILANGSVICFGLNDDRQVGQAAYVMCTVDQFMYPCEPHPVAVAGLTSVKQLALADHSTCALDQDGGVACWGASGAGELGTLDAGSTCPIAGSDAGIPCTETPISVPLGRPAMRISGGEDYGGASYCAVFADGSVSCWGSDTSGQLAIGVQNTVPNPTPQPAQDENGPLSDVVEVASGDTHRCALKGDAAVVCWGMSDPNEPDGRLGTPNLSQGYALPVQW